MGLGQKKPKRCLAQALEEAGALGDHTAVAADSTLVVSLEGGKRTYAHTLALVQDTKSRLRQGYLPTIFPEAFVTDESALVEVFGRRDPPAGRHRCPVMRWPQGVA
jgi:hypothetical protein